MICVFFKHKIGKDREVGTIAQERQRGGGGTDEQNRF